MIKEDEKWFWKLLFIYCPREGQGLRPFHKLPRDLINQSDFPINYKRAHYLLQKWTDKGLYNYGVSVDLGWITPVGANIPELYEPNKRLAFLQRRY